VGAAVARAEPLQLEADLVAHGAQRHARRPTLYLDLVITTRTKRASF
jgi:hypothetical protein